MSAPEKRARKFGRFVRDGRTFAGEVIGDAVHELESPTIAQAFVSGAKATGKRHGLSELTVLAPVDRPSKIVCIGLNYRSHIREMKTETPEVPVIFSKPSSAIIGPEQDIEIPPMSSRVDYEGESAIIIGRRAKNARNPEEHILGYTCFNDVTARDLQKQDVDWTRAKGFDTFAPLGPLISTAAPTQVTTRLNGKVVQDSLLSDRVFGDAELIRYISTIMTLEPGDIIATGTPSGISPMKSGDVVEVELDSVGVLRNRVASL